MPDLHLTGVDDDGRHLLLAGPGGEEFLLPIDDALRAALRRDRGRADAGGGAAKEPLRPRDVQAMIRAGASAAETAERAGWPVDKVHRYEGPILAERAHVAALAGECHVRGGGSSGRPVTLAGRVEERLRQRGVDAGTVDWDAWRSDDGQWTVELRFVAADRPRLASWRFSRSAMSTEPVDDEARWLSGDESAAASSPTARHVVGGRDDDEPRPRRAAEEPPRPGGEGDLMSSMREHSMARNRRRGARRLPPAADWSTRGTEPPVGAAGASPAQVPQVGIEPAEDVTPLEPFGYDPDASGPPPPAHAVPEPEGIDGRLEPAAEEWAPVAPAAPPAPTTPAPSRPEPHVTHEDDRPRAQAAPPASTASAPSRPEPDVTHEGGSRRVQAAPTHAPEDAERAAVFVVDEAPTRRDRSVASDTVDEPELPLDEHERSGSTPPAATPAPVAQSEPTQPEPVAVDPAEPGPAAPEPARPVAPAEPEEAEDDITRAAKAAARERGASTSAAKKTTAKKSTARKSTSAPARRRATKRAGAPTDAPTPAGTDAAPGPTAPRTKSGTASARSASGTGPARRRATTDGTGEVDEAPATAATAAAPEASATPADAGHATPEPKAPTERAEESPDTPAPEPTPPRRSPRKGSSGRKGRASVPAWDDIMFGAKHPDD